MIDATTASIDVAIGGTLVPFLISIVTQAPWSPKLKGAVAFLVCLGIGALLAAFHGTLTLAHWRDSAIAVTAAAILMYRQLWQPSGLAPAVEQATTVVRSDDYTPGPLTDTSRPAA